LKHIGNALLVQHRLSGRVAVTEKPDVVWDRQDLDRLYARLEDEYELKERAEALSRKLAVIADTTEIMTDTIDTRRSLRLEVIIVILIANWWSPVFRFSIRWVSVIAIATGIISPIAARSGGRK
jgi:uncharacterized Rmd1/YagE family protein